MENNQRAKKKSRSKSIRPPFEKVAGNPQFANATERLQQLVIYLAALRERQTLRTGAIGILLHNTKATFVYSDPCGTLCTHPIDMFEDSDAFITMIIFLSQMDYIAAGFDPLWVTAQRLLPGDDGWRLGDPRWEKLRVIDFNGLLLIIEGLILRRYTIHGRGTTVLATIEWIDPSLPGTDEKGEKGKKGVMKLSFPVQGRVAEANLWAIAKAHGVNVIEVSEGYLKPLGVWVHQLLQHNQPIEPRVARGLYMPRLSDFSSIEEPQELLVRLIQAMSSEIFIHSFSCVYI